MADYQRSHDGNNDGLMIGNASTDKVGFYGATPVTRPATATSVTTTAATSTTNAYGYTTAAQADAIVASLNAIILALGSSGVGLTA